MSVSGLPLSGEFRADIMQHHDVTRRITLEPTDRGTDLSFTTPRKPAGEMDELPFRRFGRICPAQQPMQRLEPLALARRHEFGNVGQIGARSVTNTQKTPRRSVDERNPAIRLDDQGGIRQRLQQRDRTDVGQTHTLN
jgi:hypothetical protein